MMARQYLRKDTRWRLPGIVAVVVLHLGIGYALLNGLARKAVEQVLDKPLLVSLIETPKPAPQPEPAPPAPPAPPPPTPKPPPPAPKPPAPKPLPKPKPLLPPPPVPAPVAAVEASEPAPVAPADQAPQEAPAPAPVSPAPVAAPAAPASPPVMSVAVVCANQASVRASVPYPGMARRRSVEGRVVAEFVVGTSGRIEDVQIASSASPLLDEAVLDAVQRFRCTGQAFPVRIRVPFEFNLK